MKTIEQKSTLENVPLATRPSALAAMASRFCVEPQKLLDTLKETVFKGATNEQLMALVVVANEFGLNPFCREIYAFPDSKSGGIVPVISIDGWINRMQSHAQFDGIEFEFFEENGKVVSCTATIWRKDRSKPTTITEFLSECFRKTDPWQNQPRRMLRHRALIQCARIAFGFSGMDPEDAEFAAMYETRGRVITPRPQFLSRTEKAPDPEAPGDPKPEPLDMLAERIEKAGVTRTGFVSVAADLGILPEEQEWSFLMPEEVEAMLARFDEIIAAEKEGRTE
jgi:phage recombination protein Bet